MTCEEARILIQDRIDGLLRETDSEPLERHLERCSKCRAELAELSAIDAVLANSALIPAPRWLPDAVATEIVRRASVRRTAERIAVGAGVPLVSAAVVAALRPLTESIAAKARLADVVAQTWGALGDSLPATTRAPEFATLWSQNPGAQGFVLALGVAALALFAVVALKLSRQIAVEWH